MEYRILGRTGLRVSAVALGCEGFIHKTPEEVCADFDFAIGHGVNFIDIYSPNPELRTNIGAALEGRRGDFVIQGHLCTTWENGQYLRTRDPEKTLASFDLQLQQLRTDCLDIGMIHYVDAEADFHRVFGGEIIRIAQRLREEGRIRHIGISSHNPAVARMAVETGLVDVLMFSVNPCYDLQPAGDDVEALWAEESYAGALRNIDPDRERLYELCERTGVGIDAMKVYGGGDLLNAENSPFGKAMTPVQCIEYALTRPGVASVMVGCRTQDEIRAALDWCGASPAERDYASAMAGTEWVPQAGISLRAARDGALKAMVSKGFRNPVLRELYMFGVKNPDLKPERLWNYELSWTQRLAGGSVSYGVNLFYIKGEDIIRRGRADGRNILLNQARIENWGAEADAAWRIGGGWSVNANYSWLRMEYPVPASPEHKLYAGGDFGKGRWSVSTGVQYIAGLYTAAAPDPEVREAGFVLWNLRASLRVNRLLTIFVRGENLLAERYEINAGYPMPRATVFGGLKLNL